ncbi:ribosomal protection-like ABC-F family protein [Streptomyces sp. WMMC905]|uniref:ribosomal protection-like ABC-F family protein n=1 Tax=Streptomyces sp. WMMC905 TaxID=3404123 RepID=UPI003B954F65
MESAEFSCPRRRFLRRFVMACEARDQECGVRFSNSSTSSFVLTRSQLALDGVTKRYDDRVVLEGVSFTVKPGEKVGIIGDNGSGKSTLLRLMGGLESPDNGEVTVAAPGGVGQLSQRLELPFGGRVRDVLDAAFADLRELERRLRAAEAELDGAGRGQLSAYGDLLEEFEARDPYQADARADAALHGLGLPGLDRDRPVETLSGGEQSRLALAAVLASEPELLLLDEPTNDLDDRAVAWLEERLREHKGTVVVVTHDRAFLEAVTSAIAEVDPERRSVTRYGNGYQGYLEAKAAARARWEREYETYLEEVARQERLSENAGKMLASISRKGPWAFSGNGHHRARSSSTATSHRVRQANERLRRLREEDAVPRPPEPLHFTADLDVADEALPAGEPLCELAGTAVDGRLTLDTLRIAPGERLLVTGPNGAGKSTLLRLLAGELRPDRGEVRRSGRAGLLRQDHGVTEPRRTLLAEFASGRPGHPDEYAEELLSLGLFREEDLVQPMGSLSVGQRRRAELARLVAQPVDLLLLDEPTNHLSPLVVEELQDALGKYSGAVVVVTHDRRLRSAFEGTRLHLENGARVTP